MFDIGFWELVVVGVVALIVIGPERLPGVARTAGLWVGRMRHFVSTVKADIDREMKAEELKQIIAEQNKAGSSVYEFIEETTHALDDLKKPDEYLVRADEKPAEPKAKPAVPAESLTANPQQDDKKQPSDEQR